MNALLHRHCAKYIYILPDGLRELMSDISREVLRTQPEQMYTFIADYLDALMITRENCRVAARLVECITEIGVTIVELLTRTGISRDDANKAAAIIQVAFRRHLELKREFQLKQLNITKEEEEEFFTNQIIQQCGISHDKADEAARIIQDAYRKFRQHERVEHDLLLGMIDWRVAARSAIYLYRKTGVSIHEADRAATLIKAAYKGYYTRQVMRRLVEEGHDAFDMEVSKYDDEGALIEEEEEEEEEGEEGAEGEIEPEKKELPVEDVDIVIDENVGDMDIASGMYDNIVQSLKEEEHSMGEMSETLIKTTEITGEPEIDIDVHDIIDTEEAKLIEDVIIEHPDEQGDVLIDQDLKVGPDVQEVQEQVVEKTTGEDVIQEGVVITEEAEAGGIDTGIVEGNVNEEVAVDTAVDAEVTSHVSSKKEETTEEPRTDTDLGEIGEIGEITENTGITETTEGGFTTEETTE